MEIQNPEISAELNSNDVHNILKEKGRKYLFHANTVSTSKTFLENKGLLSRKYVEDHNLFQSPQKSDALDKSFGIWDHIFLDSLNISWYFNDYNRYGPILFAFSTELLLSEKVSTVRITKDNPIHWKHSYTVADKYYTSIEEFSQNFMTGNKRKDSGTHITITCLEGKLEFNKYLHAIQIDDPEIIFSEEGKEVGAIKIISDYLQPYITALNLSHVHVIPKTSPVLKSRYHDLFRYNKKKFRNLFARINSP